MTLTLTLTLTLLPLLTTSLRVIHSTDNRHNRQVQTKMHITIRTAMNLSTS